MSQNLSRAISVIGIDIGKNSFHIVGLDERGAIALRQKWSRGQVEADSPIWVTCGRRLGKSFLRFLQHWSGAVTCPAC